MLRAIFAGVVLLAAAPGVAQGEHPANNRKVIITDARISGVRSIGTTDLEKITGQLTGKPISGDESEISDRLRFAFQDSGYFAAEVKDVRVKVSDGLANPTPVVVEADVKEGPLFHIGEVKFAGNHEYASDQLRAQFPVKRGDVFTRSKIAGGLEAIRILYAKRGYINFTSLPNTEVAADSVNLNIDVDEGRQYRLGSVEFVGNSRTADELRSRWQLEVGQPFDRSYVAKFFEENRSLFPVDFDLDSALKIGRNCKTAVVALLIELDAHQGNQRQPEDAPCESWIDKSQR